MPKYVQRRPSKSIQNITINVIKNKCTSSSVSAPQKSSTSVPTLRRSVVAGDRWSMYFSHLICYAIFLMQQPCICPISVLNFRMPKWFIRYCAIFCNKVIIPSLISNSNSFNLRRTLSLFTFPLNRHFKPDDISSNTMQYSLEIIGILYLWRNYT